MDGRKGRGRFYLSRYISVLVLVLFLSKQGRKDAAVPGHPYRLPAGEVSGPSHSKLHIFFPTRTHLRRLPERHCYCSTSKWLFPCAGIRYQVWAGLSRTKKPNMLAITALFYLAARCK